MRVSIYLPDDLAQRARKARLNISAVAQQALRRELRARQANDWIRQVKGLPPVKVTHERVIAALDETRREIE